MRVLSRGEDKTDIVECKHCNSTIEYQLKETVFIDREVRSFFTKTRSYTYKGIVCPVCEKEILITFIRENS